MLTKGSDSTKKSEAKGSTIKGATNKGRQSESNTGIMKKLKEHVLLATLLSVAVVIASVAVVYLVTTNISDTEPVEQITVNTTFEDTELTYRQRADQLEFYDDYEGAQQLLQDGADKTAGNSAAEAEFYIRKAELAFNSGYYEDGLSYAVSADENNPTVSSAVLVAESAMKLGDNETAIKYFTLAANRTSEESKNLGPEISEYYYYINQIELLGGTYEN